MIDTRAIGTDDGNNFGSARAETKLFLRQKNAILLGGFNGSNSNEFHLYVN